MSETRMPISGLCKVMNRSRILLSGSSGLMVFLPWRRGQSLHIQVLEGLIPSGRTQALMHLSSL